MIAAADADCLADSGLQMILARKAAHCRRLQLLTCVRQAQRVTPFHIPDENRKGAILVNGPS